MIERKKTFFAEVAASHSVFSLRQERLRSSDPCGALFLIVETQFFDASPKIVTVSRGENFSQAVDAFSSAGLLSHPAFSNSAAKFSVYAGKIKIGNTSFQSGVSNGNSLCHQHGTSTANPSVTIYEGLRERRLQES